MKHQTIVKTLNILNKPNQNGITFESESYLEAHKKAIAKGLPVQLGGKTIGMVLDTKLLDSGELACTLACNDKFMADALKTVGRISGSFTGDFALNPVPNKATITSVDYYEIPKFSDILSFERKVLNV